MDRYGISWEYREHNMLVSHRQYISKDKLVQGPLLIFIDFASWYLLNDNFVIFVIINYCYNSVRQCRLLMRKSTTAPNLKNPSKD